MDRNTITTLIFDLDGLLADTETLHRQAYQEVLGGLGIPISDEEYDGHWIRDGKGIVEFIAKRHLAIDPALIRPGKAARYRELVTSSVKPMPGALLALQYFHGRKTLALATSSYAEAAFAVLETLGITPFFSCIATKANAKRMKPFPDLFLWVATALGVSPEECLVIEDAEKGILAAHAAGMRSVAIPNNHTRDNDFSKATMCLPSLEALTLQMIEELEQHLPISKSQDNLA